MLSGNQDESFVKSLTGNQNRLYGYIYTLMGDHHDTADVLQECNIVLWRKAKEFKEGSAFIPWAFAIARFQVLAHLRDRKRKQDKLLSPEVAELIASELEGHAECFEDLQTALRLSVNKLPDNSRHLIDLRYFRRLPVQHIAEATERKLSAVKVALMRVRQGLKKCIDRELEKVI